MHYYYCHFAGDDEKLCNRVTCPQHCRCRSFSMDCTGSRIQTIPTSHSDNTIRILHLSHNNLSNASLSHFHYYIEIVMLYVKNCSFTKIPSNTFREAKDLRFLDMSYNSIHVLHKTIFRKLTRLQTLILRFNKLQTVFLFIIEPSADPYDLLEIDISVLNITYLPPRTFHACPFLKHVNLSFNNFVALPAEAFSQAADYLYIGLKGIPLTMMHSTNIYSINHIAVVDGELPELCCFSRHINDCRARKISISSCRYLISPVVLQICIWVNGLTVTILNIAVLLYRLSTKKIYKKWSAYTNIYTINMAVSDLLMGLYMVCLAVMDTAYSGRYASVSLAWRMSNMCKSLALISTVSSEMSLTSLLLLNALHFVTIRRVYGTVRRVRLYVAISILITWTVAALLSAVPIMDLPYFGGLFRAVTGTCIMYQLTSHRDTATEYALAFWFVGNLLILLAIAGLQIGLGIKIYKSRSRISGSRSMRSLHTKTLFLLFGIAAVVCWAPVLTTMLLANVGVPVSHIASEYIVILMLPMKCFVNPILYTARNVPFTFSRKNK